MPVSAHGTAEPLSSAEFSVPDLDRADDIDFRQQQVAELIGQARLDGVLLTAPENFAWFTVGGSNRRGHCGDTTASLFITPDARVVVTNNVDSQQVFDRELNGMGFQLKERPWFERHDVLLSDLCRGRSVGCDRPFAETKLLTEELEALRVRLNVRERGRLKELGRDLVHAVEATARTCEPGQSEAVIAGELAHRMVKRGVEPVRLQTIGDGRARLYPHNSFGNDPVVRWCTIAAVGRRNGLHVALARTVSFGEPPELLRDAHRRAVLMQATGMFFSQQGWTLGETWQRVARIYEKFGCPDEWQLCDQADVIGYNVSEHRLVPDSGFRLADGMALHWHPSVGAAPLGDTILVTEDGHSLVTPVENWPLVKVTVRGTPMERPDILVRG